jgi:predicted dehydrogenase
MKTNHSPTTSRRRFIATSTAALGFPTIIPAAVLGRGGRPAPSERVTVGLIGYGTIALGWTKNFLSDERCQVVSVADPMKESGHYGYKGELQGGRDVAQRDVNAHYSQAKNKPVKTCSAHVDFREMMDKEDLDVVQVSTPDHWHACMAVYAARKGKHIYGQKPVSLTIADGRLMADEVKKSGITWQTGSQQRSDIYFRMACEFVRNGRLGKVKHIRVGLPGGHTNWNQMGDQQAPCPPPKDFDFDLWLGPAPQMEYRPAMLPLNWRHNYHFSGGMITDFGAHHIDIAQWAMDMDQGGPVEFNDISGTLPPPADFYNTATTFKWTCKYESGVEMVVADSSHKLMPEMEGDAVAGKNFDHTGIFFEGENGKWLWVNRGKITASSRELLQDKIRPEETHLYASADHTRNFIDCIYSGKPTAAPIETAHRTISIAHLGNIGIRLGRKSLKWNPQAEQVIDDAEAHSMLKREWRKPWAV